MVTFSAEEFSRIWALFLARLPPGKTPMDDAMALLTESAVEYLAFRGRMNDGGVAVPVHGEQSARLTRYLSPSGAEGFRLELIGPDGDSTDLAGAD